MKKISVGQGFVALVDDEDYERAIMFPWKTYDGRYALIQKSGKAIYLHHFIYGKKIRLDHKDRNGLNNQKNNLRPCTQSQNMANSPKKSHNTSGYKGVCLAHSGKWRARIIVNQKRISLGNYENIIDAAMAYDEAALKYFGEFAVLNFP